MRHQQPTPAVVAITALLAAAAGLLTLWYVPVPLVPRAIFAVISALVLTAVSARANHASFPGLAIEVSLLYTTAAATLVHVLLTAAMHLLGALQGWLERARTHVPTYTTAA